MSDDAADATVPSPSADSSISTRSILAGAYRRFAANPTALVALLVAGAVVAGADWFHLHDPVPVSEYEGVQQGRFEISFGFVVSVVSRTILRPSALLHLEPRWLVTTVGLELAAFVAIVAASSYALSRLLDVRLTLPAVLRYGLVSALLRFALGRVNFEGGAILVGIFFLMVFLVVVVRLVPFPGRLILGESFRTALGRSWDMTRGHGWSLFGVVLVVGLANHLLASVPLVGPVGSAAVGAVHAGIVATVIHQLHSRT